MNYWITRIDDFIEKHAGKFLFLIVALSFVGCCVLAAFKPFWYDELYTYYAGNFSSLDKFWSYLLVGFDPHPPVQYLAVRLGLKLVSDPEIGARLGFIVAYLVATVCIFFIIREYLGAVWALVGVLIFSCTTALPYAYEARPYAFALGFTSLALLGYLRRVRYPKSKLAVTLFAIGMVGAPFSNYFTTILIPIFIFTELFRIYQTRRIDIWIVCTMLLSIFVPILLLPYIRSGSSFLTNFWSPVSPLSFVTGYRFGFHDDFVLISIGVVLLYGFCDVLKLDPVDRLEKRIFGAEKLAIGGIIAAPIAAVLGGFLITGGYVPRYTLYYIIGFTVVITIILARLAPNRAFRLLVLGLTGGLFLKHMVLDPVRAYREGFKNPAKDVVEKIDRMGGETPIAITNGTDYFPIWHYAPEKYRDKIIHLTSSAAELQYTKAQSTESCLEAAKAFIPLSVTDLHVYAKTHSEVFLLGTLPWQIRELGTLAQSMTIVDWVGDKPLYLIWFRGHGIEN